ncbi:hypothetical protein GCM10025869_36990 [Homoserinibacter gongjuensis]|uniref:Uncharacterized protein n=1 Tax=Homoserinibacter gongjuensis TaxID=1162968 RepID=A0ABQ6K0W4_9MICO|nr:hypothetical protein GCM10025869_36990 [Homoserinibacter gongjuensis]
MLGAGEWVGVTRLFTANPEDPAPGAPSISVNLAIDPAWQQRVRIVEEAPRRRGAARSAPATNRARRCLSPSPPAS